MVSRGTTMKRSTPQLFFVFVLLCLVHTTVAFLPQSLGTPTSWRIRSGASVQPLGVKRQGRRGGGGSGTGRGDINTGGKFGSRRRNTNDGAEASKDPEKRLINLNRKLTSILEVRKGLNAEMGHTRALYVVLLRYISYECRGSWKHLMFVIQLERISFEDLNEDQRRKVDRKEEVLEEISRLTKRVRKEDFM